METAFHFSAGAEWLTGTLQNVSPFSLAEAGLWDHLVTLLAALWGIFVSLVSLVVPWTPLAAWIIFWLFAVNWVKLREIILQGGWIPVVLIGLVMVLVWGTIAPPPGGTHELFGLSVSNYVGKFVYVTILFCIMFLCGAVQLAGFLPGCCPFEEEAEAEPADSHTAPH